jgi:hypothetical protein
MVRDVAAQLFTMRASPGMARVDGACIPLRTKFTLAEYTEARYIDLSANGCRRLDFRLSDSMFRATFGKSEPLNA